MKWPFVWRSRYWISFSDQQPTSGPYLVTDGKAIALIYKYNDGRWDGTCCGRIIGYDKLQSEDDELYLYEEDFTHWMPLPSMPKQIKHKTKGKQ